MFVVLNPNADPGLRARPLRQRLQDLHLGLGKINASLWIDPQNHTHRFASIEKSVGDAKVVVFRVCSNRNMSEEVVRSVVEQFGFSVFVEPEVVREQPEMAVA